MVCDRCIVSVTNIFLDEEIMEAKVQLGKATVANSISTEKYIQIESRLKSAGFEILDNTKSRLIEQVKNILIDLTYHHAEEINVNFSVYLSDKINLEYNYLSSLFSSVAGISIEKYYIQLKIERVKELLVYDEKTISEIAYLMGYSSAAHLSGQFKKVTGFTPTYFKKLGEQKRKSIDNV
jgi:AraC family transcriptional regulator